jgi:CBS domain-containing protein
MRRDVVTVTPQTSLREAGALLLEQDVGCLPVLDENNALVGMLTSSDYVRLVVKAARGRV